MTDQQIKEFLEKWLRDFHFDCKCDECKVIRNLVKAVNPA